MTRPALELANPKFIDFMVGRRSDGGIDGYLGIQVVEFEAGRLVAEFDVPFEYPRKPDLRSDPQFAELSGMVSAALREAYT